MREQIVGLEYLSLREQLRLLEIAANASNHAVRELAFDILNQYRHPPMIAMPHMDCTNMPFHPPPDDNA